MTHIRYGTTPSHNILITGAGFGNQGAYMMLLAVARRIRDDLHSTPALQFQYGTERQRRFAGLDTLMHIPKIALTPHLARTKRARARRAKWPYLVGGDIDAVVDISGFAFGDQWDHDVIDRRAKYFESWAARDVPVYFLPQAYGPFEKNGAPSRRAISSARIAYSRDPESDEYARRLLLHDATEVRMSPDFTIGIAPAPIPHFASAHEGGVPLIPNWNIFARATAAQQEEYLHSLSRAALALRSRGHSVYGLSHEGAKDARILELVRDRLGGDLPILVGMNGLQSKALIATAPLTVSGRFHAVVSALSQGVPTVVHGWSHKYRWLTADFGSTEFVLDPYSGADSITELIDRLLAEREPLRERLLSRTAELKKQVDVMWDDVLSDIRSRLGDGAT